AAGRIPSRVRNAPRALDLDLLLYGSRIIASPRLTVPHPRLSERRFVLVPLADLVPRRVVPGLRRTVATLLRDAPAGEVVRIGRVNLRPPARSR
ncbi:MAG: 2-amino-4-hydroxy-6-hydroxymethyldihydropteridine diphosphokinase, partial [Thermoanaerobaculia bacterium]